MILNIVALIVGACYVVSLYEYFRMKRLDKEGWYILFFWDHVRWAGPLLIVFAGTVYYTLVRNDFSLWRFIEGVIAMRTR